MKDAGLINWSHQQFIDIPRFNGNSGIAYKYTIPCWEYGTNTPILKGSYFISNDVLTISVYDKINKYTQSKFNINLKTLRAGYKEKRDYICIMNF